MSIFNELLSKINEISNSITKNFDDDLKKAFECLDKFEEEFQNGKGRTREKALKDKSILTSLQSIDEGEVTDIIPSKEPEGKQKRKSSIKNENANVKAKTQDETQRPKKRSTEDIDDPLSPGPRPKRNASAKAQSNISKQVNMNLMQKLRREDSMEKNQTKSKTCDKDEEKENTDPIPLVRVKQEKISIPPEPMDLESLPLNIAVKVEIDKDGIAMPPPSLPVPRPRRIVQKDKPVKPTDEDEGKRRNTRTRKQKTEAEIDTPIDNAPAPSARSTRASSRNTRTTVEADDEIPKDRPKRTRGRKKVSESNVETDKDSQGTQDSGIGSPVEKPRPKRTRKAQKAVEKEPEPVQQETISPKVKTIPFQAELQSPILVNKSKSIMKANTTIKIQNGPQKIDKEDKIVPNTEIGKINNQNEVNGEKRQVLNTTVTINNDLDKTVVLPNGVYNHAPVTPKDVRTINNTVVIETCNRETIVLDKTKNNLMDATVVLERLPVAANVTEDNSLLTDDDDFVDASKTPTKPPPKPQTNSAVKEKVQQFEQMASRVTRIKTRGLTKKDDSAENHTPPDKMLTMAISAESLTKMNNMIFNGKTQISSSASKPRTNIPVCKPRPGSTSKISSVNRAREEELQKAQKEDARRKKEALLEAKREMQRKKREDKMAAAAAAREAAERERQAAMEAAARERMEKQAHVDQGKLERLKETERKKQELARKVAETEERRRAEEQARAQRLADEMKRAEAARRKQMQEQELMKKEALIMAKEIEKRQKEYMEKQKMKLKYDGRMTPVKVNGKYPPPEPVYMCDGFQHLNSGSEDESTPTPEPIWSSSKFRRRVLKAQDQLAASIIDKLFSVKAHSPDLREIFPNIERNRLKRTSSAVWRTPESRYKT